MTDGYTDSEFMRMQDKAIESARQMQERAKCDKKPKTEHSHNKAEKTENQNDTGQSRNKKPSHTEKKPELDRDAATLLPLIFLLMQEGADRLLLLALMYIIA